MDHSNNNNLLIGNSINSINSIFIGGLDPSASMASVIRGSTINNNSNMLNPSSPYNNNSTTNKS